MSAKKRRGRLRIRVPQRRKVLPPAADNEPAWKKTARAGQFRLELVARLGIAVSLVNFILAAFSVNVQGMFFQLVFLAGFFLVREGSGAARLVLALTSAVMIPFLALDLFSMIKTAGSLSASNAVSAALALAIDGFYLYALWVLTLDKKVRLFFRLAAGKKPDEDKS